VSAAPLARAIVTAIAEDPVALAQLRELLRNNTDHQEPQEQPRRAAYTVATLAAELNLSPKVVRAAIRRGELAGVKHGRRWIISCEAVTAWAAPVAAPPRRTPMPSRSPRAPTAAGPSLRSVFGEFGDSGAVE
jgi:excisionase family DNA binding protein